MNDIQASVLALLPPKRKQTPSGWTSFNAVCCLHRNEAQDRRQRGGLLINLNGGFQYHCFNCNFNAGYTPGHALSKNTKNLLKWLGMTDSDVNKFTLLALKEKEDQLPQKSKISNFDLEERALPEMTLSLVDWASQDLPEETEALLVEIFKYLEQRQLSIDWYPWHWSLSPGYRDRLLIPFYHQGKVVGWTGRKVTAGKPKYLTHSQPGYVFNIDAQSNNRQYVIVVEGQIDAIAIDGVAIMHNEPSDTQIARINALGKQTIVVPDRDRPGAKMIKAALEHNWLVSLPPWEDDVKDTADAVKKYGRLYTLTSILHHRETSEIKIQLMKKKLEAMNE